MRRCPAGLKAAAGASVAGPGWPEAGGPAEGSLMAELDDDQPGGGAAGSGRRPAVGAAGIPRIARLEDCVSSVQAGGVWPRSLAVAWAGHRPGCCSVLAVRAAQCN